MSSRFSRAARAKRYMRRPLKRSRPPRTSRMARTKLRALANLRTAGDLGREIKFTDTWLESTALASSTATAPKAVYCATNAAAATGPVSYLNLPAVGSSGSQRDGRNIRNLAIELVGSVHVQERSVTDPFGFILIALVLDTQANGSSSAGTGANVFLNSGAPYASDDANLAYAQRNMSQAQRYRVLGFRRLNPNPPGAVFNDNVGAGRSDMLLPFSFYRRLGFTTNFVTNPGATPADSDLIDNGLFLMAWRTGTPDATNSLMELSFNCRVRFVG